MTETLADAAKAIAAEPPSIAEWMAGRGRAVPNKKWITQIRRANWLTAQVTVDLPGSTSDGRAAHQFVTIVPATWLRALAARLGAEWPEACRWEIPDPERPRGRPRVGGPDAKPRSIRLTDEETEKVEEFVRQLRGR